MGETMNSIVKKGLIGSALIFSSIQLNAQEIKYNASDVVRYALTSHGIEYLLRDRRGATNRWSVVNNLERFEKRTRGRGRYNTDCSGLASAAIRYGGYRAPDSPKSALSTLGIQNSAARGQNNLRFVGRVGDNYRELVRHGDMLNVRIPGRQYGHVFLFNGHNSRGQIETVEARSRATGVGRFTRTWNRLHQNYRIVRSTEVYDDVQDTRKVFQLSDADAANRQYAPGQAPQRSSFESVSSRTYEVVAGDTGSKIAQSFGISLSALQSANPGVNWRRLQIGQKLNIPS